MLLSEQTSQSITERGLPVLVTAIVFLSLVTPLFAGDKQKDEDTLMQANIVLQDMLNSNSISPAVLSKADCVLILPGVKKVGFGVGGSGGPGPCSAAKARTSREIGLRLRCIRSAVLALVCK